MTLKKGALIVIENTDKLSDPIEQFHKKWAIPKGGTPTEMVMAGTPTEMVMAFVMAGTATEKQTGKKIKLQYYGSEWKTFENKRLIGIVTEITKEDHRDFDLIKIREQTGGVRYCRRYILENV